MPELLCAGRALDIESPQPLSFVPATVLGSADWNVRACNEIEGKCGAISTAFGTDELGFASPASSVPPTFMFRAALTQQTRLSAQARFTFGSARSPEQPGDALARIPVGDRSISGSCGVYDIGDLTIAGGRAEGPSSTSIVFGRRTFGSRSRVQLAAMRECLSADHDMSAKEYKKVSRRDRLERKIPGAMGSKKEEKVRLPIGDGDDGVQMLQPQVTLASLGRDFRARHIDPLCHGKYWPSTVAGRVLIR